MLKYHKVNKSQFDKAVSALMADVTKESFSDEKLQNLVRLVSETYFSRPFIHKARFNSRLRTTGGRYHLVSHDLDFNLKVYEVLGLGEFIKVIKHELCHYHLHLLDMGYRHRDADFKKWLVYTGGSRFVPNMDSGKKTYNYTYECIVCHQNFYRKRRVSLDKYRCRCGGCLKLKKTTH